ncbi:MAG: hypothetical protein IKL68_01795 [Clostridia bacterium]|nr:hypothetical protein [Clostridia bacterium]
MSLDMEISETINRLRDNVLELDLDHRLDNLKLDLQNISERALEKSMNYIIKSMPVPDAIKDVLKGVKESIKTKTLKEVVETAVNSSVREGLEIVGVSKTNISTLKDVKDFAFKGGLAMLLKCGLQLVERKYLKNNIVSDAIYRFFGKVNEYILSNEFVKKINSMVDKLSAKKDEYMKKCDNWYEAYTKLDIKNINKLSEELGTNRYITSRYEDCDRENRIIQNMTKMVNAKKSILSIEQQKLCEAI